MKPKIESAIMDMLERRSGVVVALILSISLLGGSAAIAQDRVNTLSLEEERQETLEEFDVTEVPDIDAIRAVAVELFAEPIEQQDEEELKNLAAEANRFANLVDYIYDEYDDYYGDNYKYDFVQEKVIGPAREYSGVVNEFVGIRNQAYFNLGILARDKGKTIEAFLYFKDAFRLSAFDCGDKPREACMRWKAEQELQKLLGLSHIKAYVTWQ